MENPRSLEGYNLEGPEELDMTEASEHPPPFLLPQKDYVLLLLLFIWLCRVLVVACGI